MTFVTEVFPKGENNKMSVEPSERFVTRLVAATPLYFYRDDVTPPGFFSNQLRKLNENMVSQSELTEEFKRNSKKRGWCNDLALIPATPQRKRKRSIVNHNLNPTAASTDTPTTSLQPTVAFPSNSNASNVNPLTAGPNYIPVYHPFNAFMTPNLYIDLRVSSQLYSHNGDNPLDLSCTERDHFPLLSQHCTTTPQAEFIKPSSRNVLELEEEKLTSMNSVIEERQEVKITVKRCSETEKSNVLKEKRYSPFGVEESNISNKGTQDSCLVTESAIQEILKTKVVSTTTVSTKRSNAYAIESLLNKTDTPDSIECLFGKRKNPNLLSTQISAFSIPDASQVSTNLNDNHGQNSASNGSYHAFYKNLPNIFESIPKPTV